MNDDDDDLDVRRISFMTFAKMDPTVRTFLHSILNPGNVNVLGTLVTPHGELDIEQQGHQEDVGVKILTTYFARPGVVNWSDNGVNKIVLSTIKQFTRTDTDFMPLFDVLTRGTPPPEPFQRLTVDECFFAATCRLMYKLENSDRLHGGIESHKIVQAEPLVSTTGLRTSTSQAFDLNFFINRVMILPRSLERSKQMPMPTPMSNELMMEFMTNFKSDAKNKLNGFEDILNQHNATIVLPTTVQLPKLYTLNLDEHSSVEKHKTPVMAATKPDKEKGYEHKLVGFARCDGITDVGFIRRIHSLLRSPKIECYNWMAGDTKLYQNIRTGRYIGIMATASGVFDNHFTPDINSISTFWNKLCIIIEVEGIQNGTLIQWRIEERMGFSHLVFNFWNVISNMLQIAQTAIGANYSTVTTFDITEFADTIFKPQGSQVPVILHTIDLTCQVPGGTTNTAWVTRQNPREDAEFKMADSMLSAHAPSIRGSHQRPRIEDLRSQFFQGIEDINSSIFDNCRTHNNQTLHSLVTAPFTVHHIETSAISDFASIPAILKHLLDDHTFLRTGESSFNVSVQVKLLLDNPDFAQQNGISDVPGLKQFGICVCKYIHDKCIESLEALTTGNSQNFKEAFMAFYNAIYYLCIDVGTFVVSGTGSNATDLKALYTAQRLREIGKSLGRLTEFDERQLGELKGRKLEAAKRDPKYVCRQPGISNMEERITGALETADSADSARPPFQRYSSMLHNAVQYIPPEAPKLVKLDERKKAGTSATIADIKAYCASLAHQPQPGPGGEGGGEKKHKIRVKRNKSRNFRNKSRSKSRRTRRRVL